MDQFDPMDVDTEPYQGVRMVRHWLAPSVCFGAVDWVDLEKRELCASSRYWEPINYVWKPDPAPAPAPQAATVVAPAPSLPSLSGSSSSSPYSSPSSTATSTAPPPLAPLSDLYATPGPTSSPDPPKSPSLEFWEDEINEAARELAEEIRKERKKEKVKVASVPVEVQTKRDAKKKELRAKQADRDTTIAAILAKKNKEVVD